MTQTLDAPTIPDEVFHMLIDHEDLWAVVVWNDDVNTFEHVIRAFVEILGHSSPRAEQLAQRIHTEGKAPVAIRPKDEAVAAMHQLHGRLIEATLDRA